MEIATSDSGSSESEVQFEPQSSQSEVPLEPSHILQLPVELQTNIIERLPLRQDLKNVCLACKELNVVATPMLYRKIDLNLSLVGKKPIKDAFNKDNASLVHVREIRVHDPQDGCKPVDQDSLSSFVNMLAADQLTSFTFETSATISAKFTSILHKKHPRLRNYVLHLTDLKAKTALSPLPTKVDLLGVVRLSLCVGNRVDCERASELLQRAINATTLTIMCTRDATYKSDSAAKVCQDYLKRILGKRRNDKIKRLLLNRMDLSSSACAIASGLRLASLEELLLVRCVNTSQFIGSKQLMQMSLKVFINDCALEQKDDHHGALSAFLSSFDGLQHLRISQKFDSEIYEEFHWSDLESHAKSLQSLLIDDSPCPSEYDSQYAYGQCHERDQMSFHHLLHLCDKLQHLALRVPTPQDLDIDDDEILDEDFWLEFEVPQFMKLLCPLSNLRVLRLIVYSDLLMDTSEGMDWPGKLASQAFAVLHDWCPHLKAVTIDNRVGRQDCRHSLMGQVQQFSFLRVNTTDLFGRTSATASPAVKRDELRQVELRQFEPHCDILEDEISFH